MVRDLIERLREAQAYIRESGFGGAVLALPAPKLLPLPAPTKAEIKEELLFREIIVEPEILDVSADLFEGGFYNVAVLEAFKALDKFLQKKSGFVKQSGVTLVNNVLSPSNPKLVWSDRKSESEENEHKGYHLIFQGGFTGIRNPVTHDIDWISDHTTALDAILLAQHLLRKVKAATLVQAGQSSPRT